MREILFRGKRVDNGEWTYGYYCPKPYSHFPCEATIFPSETIDRDWHGERVDPDTVGRFTGLTDRNGVKIFEGDIVLHKGECGLVGYSYDYGMFEVDFDYCFASFIDISASNREVIGNIYDNPELLEVSNDE